MKMNLLAVTFAPLLYIVSAQNENLSVLELNVTVGESAQAYPERILVLPSNSIGGRPRLQLVYAEDYAPLDNQLQEAGDADVLSVLTVAALQYAALHNYSMANLGHMANTLVTQMLPNKPMEPEVEVSYIRSRRSTDRLKLLKRDKRTWHHHRGGGGGGGGCGMLCQMLQPGHPITINIIKQQPTGCSTCQQQQPPPCGHPQSPCGHPQPPPPPPPVYHPPPPPPPPVYHPPPPQQCHPCPPPPPPQQCHCPAQPPPQQPTCNTCGGGYPGSGSYSQSSANSQSSSSGWGKK